MKVAGPHAAERRVVVGLRAGGLLDGHAAASWLTLVGGRRAETRRTELRSRSARPNGAGFAAEIRRAANECSCERRLGPLCGFDAPLAAGELGFMGAAAAFSAWPPALRESMAYLMSVLAVHLRHAAS